MESTKYWMKQKVPKVGLLPNVLDSFLIVAVTLVTVSFEADLKLRLQPACSG